ncbi:MAG: crotonase/enoyl-CoA hydratase family protein [Candidatus Thorarchaeota archaeon]
MVISVEEKKEITTIIIDNPEVKNAIDRHSALELANAFREFDGNKNSKIAILWGENGCFCSGANLKAFQKGLGNKVDKEGDGPMGPTRMILSKPVIAAISGYAVAGGLELAIWCDLRVVEKNGIFGIFNRRWGIPLIDGGTVRLPRIIGLGRALDMILTGRPVNAEEAFIMGLANRIVDIGQARIEAEKLANEIIKFPQTCLLQDRLSTYEQFDYKLNEAIKNEFSHGLKSLNELSDGLNRFNKGEGRHGKF